VLAAGLAGTLAAAAGACGGSQGTTTVVVTTTRNPSVIVKVRSPRHRTFAACDANIRARRPTTTCRFAENVFYEYAKSSGSGDRAFTAYSPVTRRQYDVSCTSGSTVVCRGGAGAEVRFPLWAARAYTAADAARYAASHDTGAPDRPAAPAAPGTGGEEGGSGGCDPSYEGACLDPSAADYDCAGGSGDGPEYTGTVTVVGDDHFGLDRDGDGIACEG
jgi:hypothetical protein